VKCRELISPWGLIKVYIIINIACRKKEKGASQAEHMRSDGRQLIEHLLSIYGSEKDVRMKTKMRGLG